MIFTGFIRRRPLCFFCGVFLAVSFFSAFFYGSVKWILAICAGGLLFLLSLIFLLIHRKNWILYPLILSACIPALILSFLSMDLRYRTLTDKYAGQSIKCEMVVTAVSYRSSGSCSYQVVLTGIGEDELSVRSILVTNEESCWDIGDRIVRRVQIEGIRPSVSWTDSYLYANGFLLNLTADPEDSTVICEINADLFPYTHIETLSRNIGLRIAGCTDEDSAALIRALICGDRAGLSSGIRNRFSALGISHLLAVSGMHIGVLMFALSIGLRSFRVGKKAGVLPILGVAALYMAICSFSASVCRAFGMLFVLELSVLIGRRRDSLTALFATTALIVALFPYRILDVGLLLSFLATFGILWIGFPLTEKIRVKFHGPLRFCLASLALTYSAKLMTLPITVLYFGSDSLISPLSCLLFSPLITLILILSPILLLTSFFPPIGIQVGWIMGFLCKAVYALSDFLEQSFFILPFYTPWIKWLSVPIVILIPILMLCLPPKRRDKIPALIYLSYLCLALVSSCLTPIYADPVISLTDEKNDALILTADRHALILDNSNGGYSFWSDCLRAANERSVTVDSLLLTHTHNFQTPGLKKLLENSDIVNLFLPDDPDLQSENARLSEIARAYGCQVFLYPTGTRSLEYRGFEITVCTDAVTRSNHLCTAFFIEKESDCLLYLSASYWECDGYKELLDALPVPDKIILGAHGPILRSPCLLPVRFEDSELTSNDPDCSYEFSDSP
ncbi:MAG: ComEC/Rec2 family competence protein [Eubacteriales bacterium]